MLSELESAGHRFASFAKEVLEPAVYTATAPLDVAVHQCEDPVPYERAAAASYRPVDVGWRWGPVWSTAWFRLKGRVPESWTGRTVALRFCSGTEALLWQDGCPVQGFDVNRDAHVLHAGARGGETVDLLVEAACNRPHGATTFWWDPPGTLERWTGATPGCLERCELAVYEPGVWRLRHTYEFARQLMSLLPEDAARAQVLCDALRRATRHIDDADVVAGADTATKTLAAALARASAESASHLAAPTRCFAVGHAHIDTAWLWPIRESRRKCLRSFATVLRLMERHPGFKFLCSQPQQYAWVEADAPPLFDQITRRVREGRWEPLGAMWIEPDCSAPSGEALVRQILHGVRYWEDRFGAAAPQRVLYLPDTFGFPASLPQIMTAAGLDTFITNKLSWNEQNDFPFATFRWRGIDGSEVLAHCTPGHDYNATNSPAELRRGEANEARKDRARTGAWLQPFGHGDGGGGPTDAMIESAILARDADGLPRVQLAGAREFCAALHDRHRALRASGDDLPVWDGELYLELHRGTYTTQGWLKHANRRAELALRRAEWLDAAAPGVRADETRGGPALPLDEAWKLLLLNQFHDILPGTSIAAVYEDARAQFDRIRAIHDDAERHAVARWASAAHTAAMGTGQPMLVLNPGSAPQSGVVECGEQLHYVTDVPALGGLVTDRAEPGDVEPVRVEDNRLANGIIEATIDEAGRIISLRRATDGREACRRDETGAPTPINQLVLYEDRPKSWEAWDIDPEYVEKASPVVGAASRIRTIEDHPLRAVIEVERPLGSGSRITQRYVLEAGSSRLEVRTHVKWHERRRLLRALFPVDVRARRATYEIQFGHIERPTHRNTSWEQAMFEVCAHTWADLAEPGFGVALLNDGKYGHSCENGVLGLSLLRGTSFPDPQADAGEHEFTYVLMLHDGDWRTAGVDRAAHTLNDPMLACALPPGREGTIAPSWAPFELRGPAAAGLLVAAVKRAEDDDRLIVRLVETHGRRGEVEIGWSLPVTDVEAVDLLERRSDDPSVTHDTAATATTIAFDPFRIVTLAVTLQ